MKPSSWLVVLSLLVGPLAMTARAQSAPADATGPSFLKGRFLVGVILGHAYTAEDDLGSEFKYSPFFRPTPARSGFGPSFGLNWFSGHITVPLDGAPVHVGVIRFRPVMVGVGYTFLRGRTATNVGLVGGWAFNDAKVDGSLEPGLAVTIDIRNSWVVRPNVTVTHALTHRLALVGSAGYVWTDPELTVRVARDGQPVLGHTAPYHSHYINLTVGAAFSIF